MATESGPFEDVLLIENGDFNCHVSLPEAMHGFNFYQQIQLSRGDIQDSATSKGPFIERVFLLMPNEIYSPSSQTAIF